MGTIAAKMLIYYSPVFFFLQLLLVVNFLLLLKRYRYLQKKKWSLFVIHLSLIIILGGAFVTCLFGIEGQVHIREGESSNELVIHSSRGSRIEKLPFRLELIDFRLLRYPGSHSPSSYESSLLIYLDGEVREAEVSMNNVLDLKGYRFSGILRSGRKRYHTIGQQRSGGKKHHLHWLYSFAGWVFDDVSDAGIAFP